MIMSNIAAVLSVFLLDAAACAAESAPPAPAEREASDAPASATSKALVGAWRVSGKDLVVEVHASGRKFTGVVTEAPVGRLVGKTMFKELTFDEATGTYAGQVLAVRQKKYVPGVLSVRGDSMTLRAGEGGSSKTVEWSRQ